MSNDHNLFALLLSDDVLKNANILLDAIEDGYIVMLGTALYDNDPRELWQIPECKKLFFDTICYAALMISNPLSDSSIKKIIVSLDDSTQALLVMMQANEAKRKLKPTPPWCH